jgi:hypothetical protein
VVAVASPDASPEVANPEVANSRATFQKHKIAFLLQFQKSEGGQKFLEC